MKYEPFPHEDGAPASLQDKIDMKSSRDESERSQAMAQDYVKMLLSTMK